MIIYPIKIGSYGVVFKGIRNPKKDLVIGNLNDALNGDGDTAVSHNLYNHGEQYVYPLETTDRDENGNIKDVQVTYMDSFAKQMLMYSEKFGFLR